MGFLPQAYYTLPEIYWILTFQRLLTLLLLVDIALLVFQDPALSTHALITNVYSTHKSVMEFLNVEMAQMRNIAVSRGWDRLLYHLIAYLFPSISLKSMVGLLLALRFGLRSCATTVSGCTTPTNQACK